MGGRDCGLCGGRDPVPSWGLALYLALHLHIRDTQQPFAGGREGGRTSACP